MSPGLSGREECRSRRTRSACNSRELLPHIDEREIHNLAAGSPAVVFRGRNQLATQAGALPARIDCEQPQVTTFVPQFCVHAAQQQIARHEQQEFSFLKECSYLLGICPVRIDKEAFRTEGGVDEGGNPMGVRRFGGAYIEAIHQTWILPHGAKLF